MGLLSMFKTKNPADSAMPYLNKIPGVANEQFNPYIEQGKQAIGQNQPIYEEMAQDPMGFYNKLRGGYSLSKGYQHRMDEGLKAARSSAAAGGFAGTPRDQAEQAELVNKIMSQGEGDYMDRLMGILGGGLQGNEHMADRGFNATGQLSDYLIGNLGQQGNLAFEGEQQKNATKQNYMKMLAQLAGMAGGFALGGPTGALAGSKLGQGGSNPVQSGMYSGMTMRNPYNYGATYGGGNIGSGR